MYEDIGGWWLSLRPHVPPLRHAVRDRLDLQERQRLPVHGGDPGRGRARGRHAGVQLRDHARSCPRTPTTRPRSATYLGAVLPTYGLQFVNWWRDRLVPEMDRNFAYLEGDARQAGRAQPDGARLPARGRDRHPRSPLEDPLDAQLRPAVRDAQPAGGHGEDARQDQRAAPRAPPELGQGPQLGLDRGPLEDEGGGEGRPGARRHLQGRHGGRDHRRPQGQRARPALHRRAGRAVPEGVRLARGLEPRVHLPDRVESRWSPSSSSSAATSRPTTTTRRRSAALAADIAAAAKEILEGLEGEALEEMRAANEINLRMAPLTPDHHFYIDQGANAHVRLVLVAIGRKLVAAGALDAPDDVVFFRYNELRVFMGNPAGMDGRAIVAAAQGRAREGVHVPAQGVGRHGDGDPARLPVPEPVGLPRQVLPQGIAGRRPDQRASAPRRASSRASPASSSARTSSTTSGRATSSSAR